MPMNKSKHEESKVFCRRRQGRLFRFVLLGLTGGSLLLGLILLLVGSVMISGYNVFLDFITWSYMESAVGILAIGVIVICLSFLGFYAALKYQYYTMAIFLSFMIIANFCELLASVPVITINLTKERSQDIELRKSINMYGSDSFKDQTDWLDLIQTELECCGLTGVEDYANSTFLSQTGQLPRSCCGPLQIVDLCGQIEPCRGETASRHQTGCSVALKSFLSSKDVVFGVIGIVGLLLQTIIIVVANRLTNKWKCPGDSFPCLVANRLTNKWKCPVPADSFPCLPCYSRKKPADHIV